MKKKKNAYTILSLRLFCLVLHVL